MFEEINWSEEEKEKYRKLLLDKRILVLSGRITEEKAASLRSFLLLLAAQSQKEITLYFDSRGGDVEPGLWLYDVIQILSAPVKGIVNGRADSTALIVLQACQRRLATKHSQFRLHTVSTKVRLGDEKEIKEDLEDGKKSQTSFQEILATKTGRAIKEIKARTKEDGDLWAEEAREFGLIDEVV